MSGFESVMSGQRDWHVEVADVLDGLRALPDNSVHCCVTSPPYFSLRDYSVKPTVWGGEPGCEHDWADESYRDSRKNDETAGQKQSTNRGSTAAGWRNKTREWGACLKCCARLGCFGLERTPSLYVEHATAIFGELRRVLRPDGVFWLNIGDSYNHETKWGGSSGNKNELKQGYSRPGGRRRFGSKPKDLLGIPWQLAFSLRNDGWWLRSETIWHKTAPMTESVTDRPTCAHEKIFLFTKSQRYFYDNVASAEASVSTHASGNGFKRDERLSFQDDRGPRGNDEPYEPCATRNMRNVWTLSPESFSGAHFATMPTELARRCLLAGTSERGCCTTCSAPWKRIIEKDRVATRPGTNSKINRVGIHEESPYQTHSGDICGNRDPQRHTTTIKTVGWRPSCKCKNEQTRPCVVLDPFSGAGTTGLVARRLGLRYIGIELNPEYAAMSRKRIRDDRPLFNGA